MMKAIKLTCGICASVLLAACTSGGTPGPTINAVDPNYGKLQFAVGTVNLYNGAATGLNVVSTLRQPNGHSAYGVDTPSITGPLTFTSALPAPANGSLADPYTSEFPQPNPTVAPANIGPSLPETTGSTPAMTGTSQLVHPGTPYCDGV